MIAGARDWDAASYDRVGEPIRALGHALLDRLALNGDETVLDAGCGDGAVTAELLARLPTGRVLAVDASPSMAARARARLDPARSEVIVADLCRLELDRAVDVVFSSATFHWIADHDRLFARLHAALRPGGRLLAQCGGAGNIAEAVRAIAEAAADEPFVRHLAGWHGPWNFTSPEQAVARLERAGFVEVDAGVHTVDVTPDDPPAYYRTMILASHLERLPPALRDPFLRRVLSHLPEQATLRYVRLTLSARRPA